MICFTHILSAGSQKFVKRTLRSKEGRPRRSRPLRPKIFSISCSFSENLAKLYVGAPTAGWHPPPLMGNPGSAPGINCRVVNLLSFRVQEFKQRPIHIKQKLNPKRNNFWMFVIFSLIFRFCSLLMGPSSVVKLTEFTNQRQ